MFQGAPFAAPCLHQQPIRRQIVISLCMTAILGFARDANAQTTSTLYSITAGNGCGGPGWSGAASSGQAVCSEAEAFAQSAQPGCSVPGTFSSAIYTGTTGGGTCALSCTNQNGGNCGGSLPVTAATTAISPKDVGTPPIPQVKVGDPLVTSIGNKIQEDVDYQAPGGSTALQFVRYYNSAAIGSAASNFAQGWMHNYAASINTISATSVAVTRADGKAITFSLVGSVWTPDADVTDTLVQVKSGSTVTGWRYNVAANDSLETYDAYGNLSSIAYRDGTLVTMSYATGTGAPSFPGQLLSVTDSFGRKLTFGYVNNFIHTMTDPNGGIYTYAYGPAGTNVLSSVTYPDTFF